MTRERLIQAALDEIHDRGLHGATTQEIAKRAEVSRGALLHHFPSREALIVACMEASLEDGTRQIQEMAHKVRTEEVTLEAFLDFLWGLFSGRFFYLALEMTSAARNDDSLRAPMTPIVKRFHEALDTIWVEFCHPGARTPVQARVILNMTLCLFRGMGIQTILRTDTPYYDELLKAWKVLLPDMIQGGTGKLMFGEEKPEPAAPRRPVRSRS